MNTLENKKNWETPEIVDLDVRETKTGAAESVTETTFLHPKPS